MRHLSLRILLLAIVLVLMTMPASAQYPSCEVCKGSGYGESAMAWCGVPDPEGWGFETCGFTRGPNGVYYCRASGVQCYYLDVQG